MNAEGTLRVVVVDDSEVVRLKLRTLLQEEPGFELVGEAADGRTGVQMVTDLKPDVVVMDLNMPGMSGIEAAWRIGVEAPQSKVLVLTVSSDQEHVTDAILAGAVGYIVKGAEDEEIREALRGVARGRQVLSPAVAGKVVDRVMPDAPAATNPGAGAARPPVPTPAPHRGARVKDVLQMLAIALVAGGLLTMVGHGEEIHDGSVDGETWVKAGIYALTAFVLLNIGLFAGRGARG